MLVITQYFDDVEKGMLDVSDFVFDKITNLVVDIVKKNDSKLAEGIAFDAEVQELLYISRVNAITFNELYVALCNTDFVIDELGEIKALMEVDPRFNN